MFKPTNNPVNCNVGPFTFHHNNKPFAFNPHYDPRAVDWSTLATYDTILAGKYDDGSSKEDIASFRLAAYDKRKAQGDVNKQELKKAKQAIYDRG